MTKRKLWTVRFARAMRSIFSGPDRPKTIRVRSAHGTQPPLYQASYSRVLTLALPVQCNQDGHYLAHDEHGELWRAPALHVRNGWSNVRNPPRLIRLREENPNIPILLADGSVIQTPLPNPDPDPVRVPILAAAIQEYIAPRFGDWQDNPVGQADEQDPDRDVTEEAPEEGQPAQDEEGPLVLPVGAEAPNEGVLSIPITITPITLDDTNPDYMPAVAELEAVIPNVNHDRDDPDPVPIAVDDISHINLSKTYTIDELQSLGELTHFESDSKDRLYAQVRLPGGNRIRLRVRLQDEDADAQDSAEQQDVQRWVYLPEADTSFNVINAKEIEDIIYNSLFRMVHSEEFAPLFEHLTDQQWDSIWLRTPRWISHIVRKVLVKSRNTLFSLTPVVQTRTGQVVEIHEACGPIGSIGTATSPNTRFKPLDPIHWKGVPWMQHTDAFTNLKSRPVMMRLVPDVQYAERRQSLVFGFTALRSTILEDYRCVPELRHFMGGFNYASDSIVIRDLIASFFGFCMNPSITRSWTEFDIEKFGPDTMVEIREFLNRKWLEQSTALPGYEQFYIGDYKGKPYVLVPLKTQADTILEGKLMRHCVGSYEPSQIRRYYSIREAERRGDKLVAVRSRITFDVSFDMRCHQDPEALTQLHGDIKIQPPAFQPRWEVGSIKGVRNMNNAEWSGLVKLTGERMGIPELERHYEVTVTRE